MRPLILVLALFPAVALAQTGDTGRGNTPPGMSQDGSRPMDGAVKGGSIVPGEKGGVPNADPATSSTERHARCNELSGKLREDCLDQERSAAGGSSAPRPQQKEVPAKVDEELKNQTE
jgi:hypothetical protein